MIGTDLESTTRERGAAHATVPQSGTTAAIAALGVAGVCTFLNLYATQPLLPLFERVFRVTKAQAAWTVSAPAIAVAVGSPLVGALADRVGRRALILASLFLLVLPTALAATSQTVQQLIVWRLLQGLLVPGVYAVSLAYIGEAWSADSMGRAMAALITGNVLGGFSGRFLSGIIADWASWRWSFLVLAAITLTGAVIATRWLPPERSYRVERIDPVGALRALAARMNGTIAATLTVGFNVLFTQVAIFTYVTFHLAGPPYHLGLAKLSSLFVVYLVGAIVTPFAGRWVDRAGSRTTVAAAVGLALLGAALTLVPSVPMVVVGLAMCATATFVNQAAAVSFLQRCSPAEVRSTASGVYVSCYYVGGSAGGLLPAAAWHVAGWPGCVALVAAVQLATLSLALRFWRGGARAAAAVD
jgi:predicted MFS family arabinose efflux permease